MRLRLHTKISLTFIGITLLLLAGIYYHLQANLRNYFFQRLQTTVLNQAGFAGYMLETIPAAVSPGYVDGAVDRISSELDLRITVIDLAGNVLGDSEFDGPGLGEMENHLYRPEVQEAMEKGSGWSTRFSSSLGKDMFYLARTFGAEASRGIVRLSVPFTEIEEIISRLQNILIASFFAVFPLAVLFSLFASARISRPIKETALAARAVAEGDYTRRFEVNTNDELKDLAEAFNFMTAQVRVKMDEVSSGRSRLEAVFLSMFEGLMVVDSRGKVLLVNRSLAEMLKLKEEPAGKRLIEVIRNLEIQEIAEQVSRGESRVKSKEVTLFFPEEKIILVNAAAVIEQNRVVGTVLVFHDVSELRKLEKVRSEFVANVSHELRTPIASIKGFTETLLEGALEEKENAREFLQIILAEADRLAVLIKDLLDLSRMESGKFSLQPRPLCLQDIVSRVVERLEPQAKKRSVIVKNIIPKTLPLVQGDEEKIAQVLFNLIDNSMKYSTAGGQVVLSAKEKKQEVEVSVADTGIGIPEDDLPRIFERFYRVEKARSRDMGGTGLGLSIVKHIVQAHGGQVGISSIPGDGTTVWFTLPL